MSAIIAAIVEGVVRPLLQWFSTYRQGRLAQRLDDDREVDKLEKEIEGALALDRADRRTWTLDELREFGREHPAPGDGSPPAGR